MNTLTVLLKLPPFNHLLPKNGILLTIIKYEVSGSGPAQQQGGQHQNLKGFFVASLGQILSQVQMQRPLDLTEDSLILKYTPRSQGHKMKCVTSWGGSPNMDLEKREDHLLRHKQPISTDGKQTDPVHEDLETHPDRHQV